jgi:hypothetical protein
MNTFFKSLTYSMLMLAVLPMAVQAQTADNKGNYFRNETPVQAPRRPNSLLSQGSQWRVQSDFLNCRRSASVFSPIIRTYLKDNLLEVEVYRGGSDEVSINHLDEDGKPWMPVRGESYADRCFVRANSLYILPVMK